MSPAIFATYADARSADATAFDSQTGRNGGDGGQAEAAEQESATRRAGQCRLR